jgi:hypothetical protein
MKEPMLCLGSACPNFCGFLQVFALPLQTATLAALTRRSFPTFTRLPFSLCPLRPWLQSRADLQRLLGGLERESFDYHGVRIPVGLTPAPAPPLGASSAGGAPQLKVLRSPPPAAEGASEWDAWKRSPPPGGAANGKEGVAANGGVPRGFTTATLRSSSSSDAGSLGGH